MGLYVTLRKSSITPCPSGMMCVAQAQVNQSVNIKIRLVKPFDVGQTSPVKVCTRRGTRTNQAANMHNRPALGVIECTI